MDIQANFGCLNLKNLSVSNSKMTESTGSVLLNGLKFANPDLKELDLSRNKLGDK